MNPERYPEPVRRHMAACLSKIATGPHLSRNLSRDDARKAMASILKGEVGAGQAAAFLVALRMKREVHEELMGILDALRESSHREVVDVPDLVDIAEPYNGYVRHLPALPFVPPTLAACGVSAIVHGCYEAGPKWGLTTHRVLRAASASTEMTVDEAAAMVGAPDVGWAYLDLSVFCPALHGLADLRTDIVKRPCLSLLEKMIQPIRAQDRTHLWVGYAHREYPSILAALSREGGWSSMLAVRGVEGGVLTSLKGKMAAFGCGGESPLTEGQIDARVLGDSRPVRAPVLGDDTDGGPSSELLDRWAHRAAHAGQQALRGQSGPTADMIVLGVASVLRHLGRVPSLEDGVACARDALRSGRALSHFEACLQSPNTSA